MKASLTEVCDCFELYCVFFLIVVITNQAYYASIIILHLKDRSYKTKKLEKSDIGLKTKKI